MEGCECKADGISGTRGKQETLSVGETQQYLKRWSKPIVNDEGRRKRWGMREIRERGGVDIKQSSGNEDRKKEQRQAEKGGE